VEARVSEKAADLAGADDFFFHPLCEAFSFIEGDLEFRPSKGLSEGMNAVFAAIGGCGGVCWRILGWRRGHEFSVFSAIEGLIGPLDSLKNGLVGARESQPRREGEIGIVGAEIGEFFAQMCGEIEHYIPRAEAQDIVAAGIDDINKRELAFDGLLEPSGEKEVEVAAEGGHARDGHAASLLLALFIGAGRVLFRLFFQPGLEHKSEVIDVGRQIG